ncbi:MAG: hypothetical protein V4692_04100, partial [Bdellovibrionota bacterium]
IAALAAAAAPNGNAESPSQVEGSGSSDTVSMTEALPQAQTQELTEVMIAEVNDTTAVAVPAEALPVKKEVKAEPVVEADVAPLPAKAPKKQAAKKVSPAPAPKAVAATATETEIMTDDSAVEA